MARGKEEEVREGIGWEEGRALVLRKGECGGRKSKGGKGKGREGGKGPQGLVDTPVFRNAEKYPAPSLLPSPVSSARRLRSLDIGPHRALVQIDAHAYGWMHNLTTV